jgi:hypothetical protein
MKSINVYNENQHSNYYGHHPSGFVVRPVAIADDRTCSNDENKNTTYQRYKIGVRVVSVTNIGEFNTAVSPPRRLNVDKEKHSSDSRCKLPCHIHISKSHLPVTPSVT